MTSPPLWSFAGPSRSPNEPTLAEALRSILTAAGLLRPPTKSLRQLMAEQRLVDALADALAEEDQTQAPTRPPPRTQRA